MNVVVGLFKKIAAAEEQLFHLIPSAFPVGMQVSWPHGEHTRHGVVDYHPVYPTRPGELRVMLPTGSTKWMVVTELNQYATAVEKGQ